VLTERIGATAKPEVSPGRDALVPEVLNDRHDIVRHLHTRARVVDEDEDVGDVQPSQSEPLTIAECHGQRLRLAQVIEDGAKLIEGYECVVQIEPQVDPSSIVTRSRGRRASASSARRKDTLASRLAERASAFAPASRK
jgi:hypothetical protein